MNKGTSPRWTMIVAAMLISSSAIACGGSADGTISPTGEETVQGTPAKAPFESHEGEESASLEGLEGTEGSEGEGDVPAPAADPSAPPAGDDAAPPAAAPVPAADPAPGATSTQKLAIEAAREISAMKVTAYEHTTFVDELSGTFKYDCSGFVGYSLAQALPAHLAAVKTSTGAARPLAKDFESFFESITNGTTKGGWSRVVRAADVKAGDVVAWLKPADMVSSNTGHVMIARGPAVQSTKRADEILIPIFDSTSSPHGNSDSRAEGTDGLGTGTIGLIVDAAGKPVRYRWTGGFSAQEWTTAISLGRPE